MTSLINGRNCMTVTFKWGHCQRSQYHQHIAMVTLR